MVCFAHFFNIRSGQLNLFLMRIYIIRHGQSTENVLKNYLGSEAELTAVGQQQAKIIARRLAKLPIKLILSSDFKRAVKTVEIIRQRLRVKYLVTPFLREETPPTEFMGQTGKSLLVTRIRKQQFAKRNNKHWHYSTEENYFDLKKRQEKFIRFLKKQREENILIVGHIIATRMLVGLLIFGELFTPDLFYKMREKWVFRNTGVTICDYQNGQWKLISWNDQAHIN